MTTSADYSFSIEVQQKYRENFARHILSVSLHLQSEIMSALTIKHGHSKLRINFEPYIAIAGEKGARLSDIAEILGISRQAANQTANQIEAAGYLQRASDPSDGRAKLLVTTPRGKALMRQGGAEALKAQNRFAAIVGENDLSQVKTSLIKLNRGLGLLFPDEDEALLMLAALMPRLSNYISNRLQELTMAKDHPLLKRNFGQVLMFIGPRGGRIQQMANAQDLSKQAISVIASELEECGYLKRDPDPEDARQVVLKFTDAGKKLIRDSVESTDQLAQEFAEVAGEQAISQIIEVMARIYRSLHLEEDIFGHADTTDIRVIARQLTRQLGDEGARALAKLLLSGESNN